MKRGEIHEGIISRVSFPNRGHVQVGDTDVIVKNGIPGERVRFRIHKKKHGHAEGILLERLEQSPLAEQEAGCRYFPECGGCLYRTMPYTAQLDMKAEQVRELLDAALTAGGQVRADGTPDYLFEGIMPSPSENAYRNKMEYTFGDEIKGGDLTLGLHRRASTYDILPVDDCRIVHNDFNRIVACVQTFCRETGWPYYHRMTHEGYLRHLLVRRAHATGEILVDLVTTTQLDPQEDLFRSFADRLLALPLEGEITGILHTRNDSLADAVKDEGTDLVYGRDYFFEELLGLRFRITPFSFFQTNSQGAETLYRTVRDYLGSTADQNVFDLYSGTGTIAQIISPAAGHVTGVEIVPEAVEAARRNARDNGIRNCDFIAGDVLRVLDEIGEKPDTIILDPPRDGIHPKALPKITSYGVHRIVYISCKPTSLVRDLPVFFGEGYRLRRAVSVDMFPATANVEVVALLERETD